MQLRPLLRISALLLTALCALWILPMGCLDASPLEAVCRIPSHGGSGVAISTTQGRTWVLSAGHMFQNEWIPVRDAGGRPTWKWSAARDRPIIIELPGPQPALTNVPAIRLLGALYQRDGQGNVLIDLALIEMSYGPVANVCPIAPRGSRPRQLWSVGHDAMVWPSVQRPATVLGVQLGATLTRERPREGRSGGPLLEIQQNLVYGICSGYLGPQREPQENRPEVLPGFPGLYASHASMLSFLAPFMAREGVPPRIGSVANPQPSPPPNMPQANRPWVSEQYTPPPLNLAPPQLPPFVGARPNCPT